MNEFEQLARQGYPRDRLLEEAGVGSRCPYCGTYIPEHDEDEDPHADCPNRPSVEAEVVCQRCGDSREPEDEGFAMIVRGEPCNCCQNEDEGLCRECGEMIDVDGLCFSCYEAGKDDYLTHRFRDE